MVEKTRLMNYFRIESIITGLFYSTIFIGIIINLGDGTLLGNFDGRIISMATLHGIDINARVSLYYKAIIIGMLGLIVFMNVYMCGLFILKKIAKVNKKKQFAFEIKTFNILSLIGIITILNGMYGSSWKTSLTFILLFQLLIVIILVAKSLALRYSFTNLIHFLSNEFFLIWQYLTSFTLMIYLSYMSDKLQIMVNESNIFFYFFGFIINILLTYGIFSFLVNRMRFSQSKGLRMIVICGFPLFVSPIYLPLANELYLILNQKGLSIILPQGILFLFLIISFFTTIYLFIYLKNKNDDFPKPIITIVQDLYYPSFLVILAAILYQPPIKLGPPGELFESGNAGVAIDQLFRYGKIPLVETFNAHALSELFAPIIFTLINGYQEWASFLYSDFLYKTIYLLIAFFFLRKIISSELAFLTILFFPFGVFSRIVLPEYFTVGIVAVFVLNKILKEPSFRNYLVFWFALSFIFIWRFDIGAATIPSIIIIYLLCILFYKQGFSIKRFIGSGTIIGFFWIMLFFILSIANDVPIIVRLHELFSIISSNQIWGYSTLGDSGKLNYYLFYMLLPIMNLGLITFILYKTTCLEKINIEMFTSVLFLLFFTLFNFPRGLVRHSLVENTPIFLLGFLVLSLSLMPFIKYKKNLFRNYVNFLVIIITFSTFVLLSEGGVRITDNSFIGQTLEKFSAFEDYIPLNTKIHRYEESNEYQVITYKSIKMLFDKAMHPSDTFIDFSNSPYLYVLTKRETPMYINQTPAFLSDEITQKYYLEEIKSHSIPFVLFADKQGWTALDEVPSNIRSYRVAEYIYKNYTPFIKINGFDVWVEKDRKSEIESKLTINNADVSKGLPLINIKSSFKTLSINSQKISEEGLVLETSSFDPQLFGLLSSGEQKNIKIDGECYLQMKYSSVKGGEVQIFYAINNNSFSETHSVKVDLEDGKNSQIIQIPIPFNGILNDIRLDPPSDDRFVLQSLDLYKKDTNSLQYENLEIALSEEAELGWLPFYWGEKDELQAKEKTNMLVGLDINDTLLPGKIKTYQINKLFDKTKGNYIHVRIRSKESQILNSVTIKYGGPTTSKEIATGAFTFNVKADGQFHDYLIRASSQINWNRVPINFISITSGLETEIKTVTIRQGD